jgi:hypothetical protein
MRHDVPVDTRLERLLAEVPISRAPDQLRADIASATSHRRQRPPWLTNLKESPMRYRSQLVVGSPTLRLAAVLAVTTALLLIIAGVVVAGASPVPSPVPVPPAAVGEGWAFFSGTVQYDGQPVPQPGLVQTTFEQNGLSVTTGEPCFQAATIQTSDPRMSGQRTACVNSVTESGTDNGLDALLMTITNDAGVWTCPLYDIYLTDAGGTSHGSASGPCEGAGEYAGFRAWIVFSGSNDVYGFINSGDGPPMPEGLNP